MLVDGLQPIVRIVRVLLSVEQTFTVPVNVDLASAFGQWNPHSVHCGGYAYALSTSMVGRTLRALSRCNLTVSAHSISNLTSGRGHPSWYAMDCLPMKRFIRSNWTECGWCSSSRVTVQKIQLHQSESNRSLLAAATPKGNRPEEQQGIGVP